jgi:hypothetical protein
MRLFGWTITRKKVVPDWELVTIVFRDLPMNVFPGKTVDTVSSELIAEWRKRGQFLPVTSVTLYKRDWERIRGDMLLYQVSRDAIFSEQPHG